MTISLINSIALDIQGDRISAASREIFQQNQGSGFRVQGSEFSLAASGHQRAPCAAWSIGRRARILDSGRWTADGAKSQAVSTSNSSFIIHHSSFPGFTLFEVLLTLCLLVIMAAIVWPSLEKSFSTQRLRKAADQIRTGWCKARIKAMTTGCLLVFRYEIDGRKYRLYGQTADGAYVQTQESAYFALTQSTPTSSTDNANYSPDNVLNGTSSPLDKMLPDGIAFVGNETLVDQRAAVALNNISNAEAGWSDPIFFYPDGTTSTARLLLRNKDYRMIELFLRGLTGVVTVGDVTAAQELLP